MQLYFFRNLGSPARRRAKKILIALAGAALLALLFAPLPLTVNARDKEAAVSHAINAVLRDRRVLTQNGFNTGKGYRHLEDASLLKPKQVYFANDAGIPDIIFLKHGLKPVPKDQK